MDEQDDMRAPLPGDLPDDDGDWGPEPWDLEGPAVTISLGDAANVDPVLLAAMTGPCGLGGESLPPQFAQDQAADALRPGPILAALAEQAVTELADLSDDQLTGVLRAAVRLENRAGWQQALAVAELARRRAAWHADAAARKVPRGCRPGEYPDEELAMELVTTRNHAAHRIAASLDLTSRLPMTLAGMAAGLISADRAGTIAFYTASLTPEQAAQADGVLAAAAPGLRPDQLDRKAAALEIKLNPEAAKARREHAKSIGQRVEARRELSGNASLAGRELASADVLASRAHIDAIAARLRRAGLDGTLDQLRARAFSDLTQGRDPLDRMTPGPAEPAAAQASPSGPPQDPRPGPDAGAAAEPAAGSDRDLDLDLDRVRDLDFDPEPDPDLAPPPPSGPPAPLPANISLIVPAGTLLGWSGAPARAGAWGLLDPDETRDLVAAASRHPRTRWCTTITGPDGTAIAHGCAPGQHPWTPQSPESPPPGTPPPGTPPPGTPPPHPRDGPSPAQAARLRDLLRQLDITLEPVATGDCDHQHAEDHYTPSRKLRHLVRARSATCTAPACDSQAVQCDLDHTIAYPDGPTDECNLGPTCRRHHRTKQAPGWHLKQPQPGTMIWTTPAGRSHTTHPTTYET